MSKPCTAGWEEISVVMVGSFSLGVVIMAMFTGAWGIAGKMLLAAGLTGLAWTWIERRQTSTRGR